MKKIALLIPALLLCAATLFAQPAEVTPEGLTKNPGFRMGLSVSTVFSWLNTDGGDKFVESSAPRVNIAYGLHTDFGLGTNRNYYFSTGVFALNTGGTLKYKNQYTDASGAVLISDRTIKYRFNYINIPLTMMLRTNEVGYTVYFARVGIDNGIQFKSVYNSEDVVGGTTYSKTDETSPDYSVLYRAGLHIELGGEFNISGTTNIFVSATWNNGLNNVFSNKAQAITPEYSTPTNRPITGNSNALMITLGAYF